MIEEVARLHGVDKIPSSPPRGSRGANAHDAVYDHIAEARRILSALGLTETQGQTLLSETAAALPRRRPRRIAQPRSAAT